MPGSTYTCPSQPITSRTANRTARLWRPVSITSPDLTRADRKRVADALKAEFDEAKDGFESKGDFGSVVRRRALEVNVDEALVGAEDKSVLEEVFGEP